MKNLFSISSILAASLLICACGNCENGGSKNEDLLQNHGKTGQFQDETNLDETKEQKKPSQTQKEEVKQNEQTNKNDKKEEKKEEKKAIDLSSINTKTKLNVATQAFLKDLQTGFESDFDSSKFMQVEEGFLIDTRTNLIFEQGQENQNKMTYEQAKNYCETKQPQGKWELPKIYHLLSVLNYESGSFFKEFTHVKNDGDEDDRYWSSSELQDKVFIFAANKRIGTIMQESKSSSHYVKCKLKHENNNAQTDSKTLSQVSLEKKERKEFTCVLPSINKLLGMVDFANLKTTEEAGIEESSQGGEEIVFSKEKMTATGFGDMYFGLNKNTGELNSFYTPGESGYGYCE